MPLYRVRISDTTWTLQSALRTAGVSASQAVVMFGAEDLIGIEFSERLLDIHSRDRLEHAEFGSCSRESQPVASGPWRR